MRCAKCGKSAFDEMLMRVNPKGEKGIFYCHSCMKKHEPELYKNEMEDAPILGVLKDICYEK